MSTRVESEASDLPADILQLAAKERRVLEATVAIVRSALHVERCSLLMLDEGAGVLRLWGEAADPLLEACAAAVKVGEGVAGEVAATGKAIFVSDMSDSPYRLSGDTPPCSSPSIICVPVERHGQVVGVINVMGRADGTPLTETDLGLLESLSGFVTIALENVSLLESTDHLRELLGDLLDSLVVGVVAVDKAGTVTCWNRGAESLLGILASTAMNAALLDLAPSSVRSEIADLIESKVAGHATRCVEMEWPSCEEDGAPLPVGVTRTQLLRADGSPDGFVMAVEDLTLRREVLELKRVDEMKSNFIAMVSHELRTPLTSMRGSIRLLRDQYEADASPIAGQLLSILSKNTERLIHQVDNLIEVTQLQDHSVSLQLRRHDLTDIIDECARGFADIATERRIEVCVEHERRPLEAAVDREKIREVLTHLIDNAVKFSRVNGEVNVLSSVVENHAVVSVRDCGPGIEESDSDRIFERFIQLEPTFTRGAGGAGLGLFIARELTRLHGGTLGIASTCETGTVFALSLPLSPDRAGGGE